MENKVEVGKEYQCSDDKTDVFKVVDMYCKGGRSIVVCVGIYESNFNGLSYCGAEDTKNWKRH